MLSPRQQFIFAVGKAECERQKMLAADSCDTGVFNNFHRNLQEEARHNASEGDRQKKERMLQVDKARREGFMRSKRTSPPGSSPSLPSPPGSSPPPPPPPAHCPRRRRARRPRRGCCAQQKEKRRSTLGGRQRRDNGCSCFKNISPRPPRKK